MCGMSIGVATSILRVRGGSSASHGADLVGEAYSPRARR